MNWGDFIKEERTKRGLSRADLSQLSGVKDAAIYKMENGQKLGGSIIMIEKILLAMNFELKAVKLGKV